MVTYCNSDLGGVHGPEVSLSSLPLYRPPVQVVYTVKFLSDHIAAESDDETQDVPIGDTQSTMPSRRLVYSPGNHHRTFLMPYKMSTGDGWIRDTSGTGSG